MAIDFLRRQGGGDFDFEGGHSQGVEGNFRSHSGAAIPVSMKAFTTRDVRNLFKELYDNTRKVKGRGLPPAIGFFYTFVPAHDIMAFVVPTAEISDINAAFDRIIFVCPGRVVEKIGAGPFA
jgi:hypothetical protein